MSTHTKIYGLLTTPILHTILIPRKKEKEKKTNKKNQPDSSQCSPNVLQPKTSQVKSLLGKEKRKKKKENEQRKKKRTRKLLITPSQHY